MTLWRKASQYIVKSAIFFYILNLYFKLYYSFNYNKIKNFVEIPLTGTNVSLGPMLLESSTIMQPFAATHNF